MSWRKLEAGALANLSWSRFEDLCCEMISLEAADRHIDAKVVGPSSGSDGGRDIHLTVSHAPRQDKETYRQRLSVSPLTEDEPGPESKRGVPTAYSCKIGAKWRANALKDCDDENLGIAAVNVLVAGGFFKLMVSSTTPTVDGMSKRSNGTEADARRHLADGLWARMKDQDQNAPDPYDRIEVIGPHQLVEFLRNRASTCLFTRWREELGLPSHRLYSLAKWRIAHQEDRENPEPPFQCDAERDRTRRTIQDDLTHGSNVVWITGPPGVGKTRLVWESMNTSESLKDRVLVALSPLEARRELDDELLDKFNDLVLVIDDCDEDSVRILSHRFRVAARSASSADAQLLMITPKAVVADLPDIRRLHLEGLATHETVALARTEWNSDEEALQRIASFSGGFPWFALLLAREANNEGRAPDSLETAVDWVLASKSEDAVRALSDLRRDRLRTLFAISISEGVDWMHLGSSEEAALARATGFESFQRLQDNAVDCDRRGLLRRPFDDWSRMYITPQLLEREVLRRMTGPDAPPPGTSQITALGARYAAELERKLKFFNIRAPSLASAELELLDQCVDLDDLYEHFGAQEARLLWLADERPHECAKSLFRRIETSDLERLREHHSVRRSLVWTLVALARRREGLKYAEPALLRLALAENEAYGNNATGSWVALFHLELNHTYLRAYEQAELLERRLRSDDPSIRVMALKAAEYMLHPRPFIDSGGPRDGEWPRATPSEAQSARRQIWEVVADAAESDDEQTARAARNVATSCLREAVHQSLWEAVAATEKRIHAFSEMERVALLDVVEAIRAYDGPLAGKLDASVSALERRLKPTTLAETLRKEVGSWGIATERTLDDASDDDLAKRYLEEQSSEAPGFTWLASDEAVRGTAFIRALGRVDESCSLLEELVDFATSSEQRRARYLLASYLSGRSQRFDIRPQLDAIRSRIDGDLLVLCIISAGADAETVVWIREELSCGSVAPTTLQDLGRLRWHEGLDTAAMIPVLDALLAYQSSADNVDPQVGIRTVLDLAITRTESGASASMEPHLAAAVGALAEAPLDGYFDHLWGSAAKFLVEAGQIENVAHWAALALSRPQGSHAGWEVLARCGQADPLAAWNGLRQILEERGPATGRLMLTFSFQSRRLGEFAWPEGPVLAWVGEDEQRGRAIAMLVRNTGEGIHPIWRGLIKQFGASSSVARELSARIHSTQRAVSSLARHAADQASVVEHWLDDPDPEVRRFAELLLEDLRNEQRVQQVYEDEERRRHAV